ncbi:MAG TPA: hypothetical protein VJU59_23625 [Paraburkholderia sp.]|uniref:hypothetical protein n=1 Tax=Paraburkholderia sp. TaxID=1926495 RepID=UPI002B463D05|nr:hypothetical protein [Paraburkholderia sp.]HKR42626.1 hypothetical protein [Paraburkholderia sp.]
MKNSRTLLYAIATLLIASSAHAGWYEVRNYEGTIGNLPVHVSLQTYDYNNHDDAGRWRVDGSYYYDAHRIPIPLQGKRQPNGDMQLCEATEPAAFGDSPAIPAASPAHPAPCPIALKISESGAAGEWRDDKRALPIALHQVGALNDTGLEPPAVVGAVQVPMWHHTKSHLLVGVYGTSKNCPLSMTALRLINLKNGQVDRDMKFDCGAGMVSTPIYANVYRANNPRHAIVLVKGGENGMGDDWDIAIEP